MNQSNRPALRLVASAGALLHVPKNESSARLSIVPREAPTENARLTYAGVAALVASDPSAYWTLPHRMQVRTINRAILSIRCALSNADPTPPDCWAWFKPDDLAMAKEIRAESIANGRAALAQVTAILDAGQRIERA